MYKHLFTNSLIEKACSYHYESVPNMMVTHYIFRNLAIFVSDMVIYQNIFVFGSILSNSLSTEYLNTLYIFNHLLEGLMINL